MTEHEIRRAMALRQQIEVSTLRYRDALIRLYAMMPVAYKIQGERMERIDKWGWPEWAIAKAEFLEFCIATVTNQIYEHSRSDRLLCSCNRHSTGDCCLES